MKAMFAMIVDKINIDEDNKALSFHQQTSVILSKPTDHVDRTERLFIANSFDLIELLV
jgi:hypothetical protein